MTANPLLERLLPTAGNGPASWLEPRRQAARTWLDRHGLPTTRDESWRYTALGRLTTDGLDAFGSEAAGQTIEITRDLVDGLAGTHGGPRIVMVNGHHRADLSSLEAVPEGVTVGDLSDIDDPAVLPAVPERTDGFLALNRAASLDCALVLVAEQAKVPVPIHVVHVSVPTASPVSHPATVIRLAPGSQATVIESWVGTGGPVLVNALTSVDIADGASLTLHRIQSEHDRSIHLGATDCHLSASATLKSVSISTGGDVARTALDVVLGGDHATATLDGLYLPFDGQHHDNVITVEHAASHGTSHQRFRGIIDDRARGSFTGHVIVDAGTVGNDAAQANHSLLLTSRAESDTRPWLEILADDVQCNHGATIGRLDDAALFYLRSRGLSLDVARGMLIDAFAAAITEEIDLESLRDHVAARLEDRRTKHEGRHEAQHEEPS